MSQSPKQFRTLNASTSQESLTLNTSPSKAMFSFSKDSRFKHIKKPTDVHAYDLPSAIKPQRRDGGASPFGSTIQRFEYPIMKSKRVVPPADKYTIKGSVGPDFQMGYSDKSPRKHYSFGLGKNNLQPLFLDAIERLDQKNLLPPGPGKYDRQSAIGGGLHKSFGSKDQWERIRLKRQAQLPGPGNYGF